MPRTFEYETTLETTAAGSDSIIGSWEVRIEYEFTPGTEPSGMSGPPENYDPGAGPEIYVTGVSLESSTQDGSEWNKATARIYEMVEDWVDMDDRLRENMELYALECLEDER